MTTAQEHQLATCHVIDNATAIAPAIDNATDCATMSVQACSMHHRQHQQRHRLRTRAPASSYTDNAIMRAPASSYAIDNNSNAIDYEQERKLAACATDNTTMRAPAGNTSMPLISGVCKLAACTTDYTSYATVIAPAIDNATDCATMSVQACSMHHRQRHHKSTSIQLRHRQQCNSISWQHAIQSATPL